MSTTITQNALHALLARVKEKQNQVQTKQDVPIKELNDSNSTIIRGSLITYNTLQQQFINTASSGQDTVLMGAAGTGKTTTMQGTLNKLIQSGKVGILDHEGHKHLRSGTPGIVIVSFTKIAVNNIRASLPPDLRGNCLTIHKLLEYQPEFFEVFDEISGETKSTMRFSATRNAMRPLPNSIHTIVFEESSMVSVELHKQVMDACRHKVQCIYLGDIQQLPPVMGTAILGYKMLELPRVELTEVYRQALESPIIRLAHRIISGKPIPESELPQWEVAGQLKLHPWKKKISSDNACITAAKFLTIAYENKQYNPQTDIILIPFNKAFGTDDINKHIANKIARLGAQVTHEVIAGFNKSYYSIGDKVLYEKESGVVTAIKPNLAYSGKRTQQASPTLDYWGCEQDFTHHEVIEDNIADIDDYLAKLADIDDRSTQASHAITISFGENEDGSPDEITIMTSSEINNLTLGYALTVHKSQGCEWNKVFLLIHHSHANMLQRELLYTACTRARKELYVICEPDTFDKGIRSQRITGNTIEEKAEFFKGKLERKEQQQAQDILSMLNTKK